MINFAELTIINGQQGNLVETISLWPKTWFVESYVKILSPLEESYYNVLHFTTGRNHGDYGSRVPSLFINRNNIFNFALDKDSQSSIWKPQFPMNLDAGARFHFRVEQVYDSNSSAYILSLIHI